MARISLIQSNEFNVHSGYILGDDVLAVDLGTNQIKIGDGVTALSSLPTLGSSTSGPRVTSIASSATPTPSASTDDAFIVTALATNATFGSPGAGLEAQTLVIRIKDNGTPRTLAFNAIYRFQKVAAPTTTVSGETLYLVFKYNIVDSVWDALAVSADADIVNAVTGFTVSGAAVAGKALIGDGTKFTPAFPGVVGLSVKNVALLTTGAPADIATITVPAGLTRYRLFGSTGPNSPNYMVNESQAGTPIAGTCELRDTAAGAGTVVLTATAPPVGAGTGGSWPVAASTIFTSGTLTVRQTANSANAANISFYVIVVPVI